MAIYNNDDGQTDKVSHYYEKKDNEDMMSALPVETDFRALMSEYGKPMYSGDMFSARVKAGDEPIRDAAQAQRIDKTAKFNLIAQGLQTIFGSALAASGEVAPAPMDNPLTNQIAGAIRQMDSQHFSEIARHRDRAFRGEIVNMNQANKADEAASVSYTHLRAHETDS